MKSVLAGLTILVLGDSHFSTQDYLITTLHDALASRGAIVHSYGACGLPASGWARPRVPPCGGAVREPGGPVRELHGPEARTKPYSELQAEIRPGLVVVVMGDTMAAYDQPALSRAWIWHEVTALTQAIKASGIPCLWVGPAWGSEGGKFGKTFARAEEVSGYLADIVAPCGYVDSLALSAKGGWPTIDGQHFSTEGYRAWGEAIAAAVAVRFPKAP